LKSALQKAFSFSLAEETYVIRADGQYDTKKLLPGRSSPMFLTVFPKSLVGIYDTPKVRLLVITISRGRRRTASFTYYTFTCLYAKTNSRIMP